MKMNKNKGFKMASKQIHVLHNKGTNSWYGKQPGTERCSFVGLSTQQEAIQRATNIARNQNLELFVHRKDNGQIRERTSYGKDPCPPRG